MGKIAVSISAMLVIASVILLAGILVEKSRAAVTTQVAFPVLNPEIKDYTLVYVQLFNWECTYVFDNTANTNTGGMVALASATYANTATTVTVNSSYYVGSMTIPSGIDKAQNYVYRLMGSSDATADKTDTQIAAGVFRFDGIVDVWKSGIPVSF